MIADTWWEPHRNPSRPLLNLKHPYVARLSKFAAAIAVVGLAGMALNGAGLAAVAIAAVSLAALACASIAVLSFALAGSARDESEYALWRDVVQAMPQAVCIVDRRGRTVRATAKFQQLLPDVDDAQLARLRQLLADDDALAGPVARLANRAARGQSAVELVAVKIDDKVHSWRVATAPLGDGAQIWLLDTNEEAPAPDRLDSIGLGRIATALDASGIGVCAADASGRIQVINDVLAGWLGTTRDAITQRPTVLGEFLDATAAAELDDAAGNGAATTAAAFTATGGRKFTGRVSSLRLHDGDDATMLLLVQRAVDRTAAGGHAPEAILRAFDDAPIGATLLDEDGSVLVVNQTWRQLSGVDAATGNLIDCVADADAATVHDKLREATRSGAAEPCDITLRTPDAAERVVTMFVATVDDDDRRSPRFVAQFLDATDRRNLEQQFFQGQKMQAVGQLAGGVAHDFNNLLTAMIGFCDLLLQRHSHTDESFGDIMQIKQSANRASNLVRQLLAFSRRQTLQPRVISLTEVLADLSAMLRRVLGDTVSLRMVHVRDLGAVRVDQTQLEQVVINLAVNARDAMSGNGALLIQTSNAHLDAPLRRDAETIPAGDYVRIEVADTGTGIAPEHLARIFEPFFTTKPLGVGTGLGLSTVFGIVKQTGGFLFVDSKLGEGTAFTIYFPQVAQPADQASAAAEAEVAPDTTGSGTILLVEDEDPVRMFGARALRSKGYEVLEAASGEEAVDLVADPAVRIDLLLTDVMMPGMGGPDLVRVLRADRPRLRVICMSGHAEHAFRREIGDATDIHLVAKPFSLAQLATKVKEVLATPD